MKKIISQITNYYKRDISQANANRYEAIMLPLDFESDPYSLNNIEDEEYILEIASTYGWDQFLIIDLISNEKRLVDLYELDAA